MEKFIDKHTQKITGTIACFDRILFKGYLRISWAESMDRFMTSQGLLLKDFKKFVTKHSERVKEHAKAMAEKNGQRDAGNIGQRDAGNIVRNLIDQMISVFICNGLPPFYRKTHSRRTHFQPLGHLPDRHAQLADRPETE